MASLTIAKLTGSNRQLIEGLRIDVFHKEQTVPMEALFDNDDAQAMHAMLLITDQLVGSGRLLPDGHIGRIAVAKSQRSLGFGRQIVTALVEAAKLAAYPRVFLGSQAQAIGFYEQLGFTPYGARFLQVGIEHQLMELKIQQD